MKILLITMLLFAEVSFANVYLVPGQNKNINGTQVFCSDVPENLTSYSCDCKYICDGDSNTYNINVAFDVSKKATPAQVKTQGQKQCRSETNCWMGLDSLTISNCTKM